MEEPLAHRTLFRLVSRVFAFGLVLGSFLASANASATAPDEAAANPVKTGLPAVSAEAAGDGATPASGPFNLTLTPGQQGSYSISFRNSGTTTWTSNAGYFLKNLDSGATFSLLTCDNAAPGQTCSFLVALVPSIVQP